ncbi:MULTISPECIES: phosphatase PAP2 family protein [unclassified Ruegeria]|uniref:phosphatase PAP2 family protein n=1 Tax=unclassified Ruegeria TaxID=2625375 RepID=UPI0014898695|nr:MULTISPECIES: phosphatase PAP2 family protein [unclassified Ruegeria]
MAAVADIVGRITYLEDTSNAGITVVLAAANDQHKVGTLFRPTLQDFEAQTAIVYDYADLRGDRMQEIMDQIGGTTAYFATLLPMTAGRMAKTLELLSLVQTVAALVAQRCKHSLACRRPDAFSAQIQPAIAMPGHGALPSGHATEAFAIAETLRRLIPTGVKTPSLDDMLFHQAARIAVNRTVAGLHYPADSFAGAALGFLVADILAGMAGVGNRVVVTANFDGRGIDTSDFFASRVWNNNQRQSFGNVVRFSAGSVAADESPIVNWFWQEAENEW